MIKSISEKSLITLSALVFLAILVPADSAHAQLKASGQSEVAAKRIERGKYLVTIMFCNDCHTPYKMGPKGPEPDMSRMLSGHPEAMKLPPPPKPSGPWIVAFTGTNTAFAGPWGISYTSNLTPDKNTGLGIWTEENGQTHGDLPGDPTADAVALDRPGHRRGPEGDLRLSEIGPADYQPRSRLRAAGRARAARGAGEEEQEIVGR